MATANELVMSNEEITAALGADDSVDDAAGDESNPALDSDEDFSSWEDETSDVEGNEGDDGAAAADEVQPQVRKFKANGREIDVDMADQEGVDRLITLGLGARPLFSKVDKLTKDLAAAKKSAESGQRYEKMWKKLDSMKSDHDALYEAVFGRKYDESFKERKDWQDRFDAASPEQQQYMLDKRALDNDKRRLEHEKTQREANGKDADARVEQAERKELRNQLLPEFYKHEFSSKIKDPVKAEKLNGVLWRTVIANLKASDTEELTTEMIRREFRDVAALLVSDDKAAAKAEVKKVVDQKKKTSAEQAKVASTRNYAGDKNDFSKEKDPVKLMKRMFGRK